MLYAIITVVIAITVGIIVGIYNQDWSDGILSWISSLCIGILFMLIPIAIVSDYCSYENKPELYDVIETVNTYDLVAIKDNTSINGSIHGSKYLFGGSIYGEINSSMSYSYMIKTDQGLKMCTLPCNSCYIVETDTDRPKVVIKSKVEYKVKSNFYKDWLLVDDYTDTNQTAVFYIPTGSIEYEYNIDLR